MVDRTTLASRDVVSGLGAATACNGWNTDLGCEFGVWGHGMIESLLNARANGRFVGGRIGDSGCLLGGDRLGVD